jgi:hypothetical protein
MNDTSTTTVCARYAMATPMNVISTRFSATMSAWLEKFSLIISYNNKNNNNNNNTTIIDYVKPTTIVN